MSGESQLETQSKWNSAEIVDFMKSDKTTPDMPPEKQLYIKEYTMA